MIKLSDKARRVLNDEERIAKRDLWLERLDHVFENQKDDYNERYVFTVGGRSAYPGNLELFHSDPEEWMVETLEAFAALEEIHHNRFVSDCVEYRPYGVHLIDKILGAKVFFNGIMWNNYPIKTPVGELQMPDLEHDEDWLNVRRAAEAFIEADVKLPLFGLPVLSSPFNILMNLYGEEALCAMVEDEEAAIHDLNIITEIIRAMHRWYIQHIPMQQLQGTFSWSRTQPVGHGQICGCSSHLISGEMYAKLIAPLDNAILGEYPKGGMIHLCGMHTQHIPMFREMKNLKVVQLNDRAAGDLEHYVQGLREDQMIYVRPCPEMSCEKAVEITGGNRLILHQVVEDAPERIIF